MRESDDEEDAPLLSTDTPPPSPPPRPRLPKELSAIHTIRLMGALHIAVYHTAPGPSHGPGAAWGASWVPFFFLLSGLGPAHSRLLQPELQLPPLCPSGGTLMRRLAAVYPTHALGVLAGAALSYAQTRSVRLGQLALELSLLHAWLPARIALGYCTDDSCSQVSEPCGHHRKPPQRVPTIAHLLARSTYPSPTTCPHGSSPPSRAAGCSNTSPTVSPPSSPPSTARYSSPPSRCARGCSRGPLLAARLRGA